LQGNFSAFADIAPERAFVVMPEGDGGMAAENAEAIPPERIAGAPV